MRRGREWGGGEGVGELKVWIRLPVLLYVALYVCLFVCLRVWWWW